MEHISEARCRTIAVEVLDGIRTHFSLPSACITAMEEHLGGLKLCLFSPGEVIWYPLFSAQTGVCIGQVQAPEPARLSHVSFQPPIEGQLLRPVVCLCRYEESERIYPALVHELIHLFSSVWVWQSPQEICLHSGIAQYTYHCSGDSTALYCTSAQEVLLNERLTDYLAGQIMGIPYVPTDPVSHRLATLPVDQIARAYFEHRVEDLPLFS